MDILQVECLNARLRYKITNKIRLYLTDKFLFMLLFIVFQTVPVRPNNSKADGEKSREFVVAMVAVI